MDFSNYVFPTKPEISRYLNCCCKELLLYNFNFCPKCGKKITSRKKQEAEFNKKMEAYNYQISLIIDKFKEDLKREYHMPDQICLSFDNFYKLLSELAYEDLESIDYSFGILFEIRTGTKKEK